MAKRMPLSERLALATSQITAVATLRALAGGGNIQVRLALIGNSSTPSEMFALFAADRRNGIRFAVAKCMNTPPAVLEVLAGDKNPIVRRAVAENCGTPQSALARLASDSCYDVLMSLAQNQSAPISVFEQLIETLEAAGRRRMAFAMPLYPSIVQRLAVDPDARVRHKTAHNPNLNDQILLWLVDREDQGIQRSVALRRQGISSAVIERLLETRNPAVFSALAMNPSTPPDILALIFATVWPSYGATGAKPDHSEEALRALCCNPNTPSRLLLRIAQRYPQLRHWLTYNANVPVEVLRLLASDGDGVVRCHAAGHHAT